MSTRVGQLEEPVRYGLAATLEVGVNLIEIELPDELHNALKELGISISELLIDAA